VGRAYARARELCQRTGETTHLFPILRGLWEFYELRAEYQTALELAEQLLALAQRQSDPSLLLLAHNVLADTLLRLGEFSGAREHAEQGEALYDVHQHRSHAFLYGYDSGVHCLSFAAWTLWLLGYPDQALKKIHAALRLAQDLSHPFTFVLASHHVSLLHHLCREAQAVQERTETEIALCTEQGFALFLVGASMYRGWALVEQGQGKEGIAQIHQALADWQATGAEMARPHFLALLAEAYRKVGQAEEGLAVLAEAFALVDKTGERYNEAELYRIKGELLLAQEIKSQKAKSKSQKSENTEPRPLTLDSQGEAEACFLKAIDIARKKQAKSLELRAAMSLSRLWQQQGRKAEARQMLADVYGWFTEGFDTKDLQEAKALLEELA
jgi:predicted ATPase